MIPITQRETRKRGKYGRPCDRCAARRIRCLVLEDSPFCIGCLNLEEKCTRDRVRKKSGPKNGRRTRSFKDLSVESNDSEFLDTNPNNHQTSQYLNECQPGEGALKFSNSDSLLNMNAYGMPSLPVSPRIISDIRHVFGPNARAPHSHLLKTPNGIDIQKQEYVNPNSNIMAGWSIVHPQYLMYPQYSIQPSWSMNYTAPIQDTGHIPFPSYEEHPMNVPIFAEQNIMHNHNCNTEAGLLDTEDHGDTTSASPSPYMGKISTDHLILRIYLYQKWSYEYWPLLSLGELVQKLLNGSRLNTTSGYIILNNENAMFYALCCSVSAAVTTQLSFVSPENAVLDQSFISSNDFADEAKRVRNLFDYTEEIGIEDLLSSFFLFAHYINVKGRLSQGKLYLREAISIAQVLELHDKNHYVGMSRADIHLRRKIYYILLVTERSVCFEEGLPVILDPTIEFPELFDDEYPDLLVGFTELLKVFSAPRKEFFFEMNQNKQREEGSLWEKRQWILEVQERLDLSRQLPRNVTNPQKLNIILSRAWIRAIACHITWKCGMIRPLETSHDCFGFDFPLVNAQEFLAESAHLPKMAFETNGRGSCVKLLEMANSLSFTVQQSLDQLVGLTVLESLFGLVNKFKNDVSLPIKVYQGIAILIASQKLRVVPRLLENQEPGYAPRNSQGGTIEELFEDDVHAMEDVKEGDLPNNGLSPFSRQVYDKGMSMLTSVPSFLDMQYPQIERTMLSQGLSLSD
ncbi:hypothetical protein METBIDRAFT_31195 [Metschnikowia bicuspidata var. bicuspidata NRRL YB-4993]|uniref:Zn(2)-C6 fungal-type domain-containing protein n=1 Tax=Metschnikowia bicuspidata var. bicuspidata NRRL YB-4993 TaxID=869754 RepID=A0A1A0HDV0_9ASCO|nr:hypothetical protein METBIDRAFT_31195 [Metschnikowia bicuspidata var. bicuspidata NRRL YB-4993]OBA22269.1 hypothetical protein METBIDRAFT_31195 [Metschnikowia bicuspidata var. bicuspidata NRRL YB-4993]